MAESTVSVRLRAVTSGFKSDMRQAAGSMSALERKGQSLTNVGMGLTKTVTPAILGIGLAAGKVGMDFEHAMSGVSAVTGASESALASMSDQAQELGRTTQFSATEAAGALEFLGMAGFSAQEATEALPDTLSLAAAGGLELANAADLASNVLQQFALDVEETGRVADVLAQTATNSNTSVEQLGQAMQMAGPVANAAGLELEETAAAIGAMGNAGIQASQAGTSLRGAMTRLLNASGPAAETIARLGINAENADGTLRPLDEIIDQLGDSGATAGDMMEIFGQRAGPAMAALVEQGGDSLRDLTDTINDSAGAAERMADERMDNLNGDLKELRSAAEGAGIALFEAGIGDSLRSIAQGATGALQNIAGLPDPLLKTATGLGAVAAAAGPAITGVGMIASKGPAIAANFKTGLSTMRRFSSFLMGPWGVAIAAAGAGLLMMIERSQRMDAMGDRLRQTLDGVAASAETLSDEWLINELRQRDVLTTVRDMGIDFDTLKAAIAGNADAQAELNEEFGVGDRMLGEVAQAIPGVRNEQSDLMRALEELTGETANYNEELEAENDLLDYLPSAAKQAEDGLMGMRGTAAMASGTFAELSANTDDAKVSVEDLESEVAAGTMTWAEASAVADEHGLSIDHLEDGYGELEEQVEDARAAQERYMDAVRAAEDPVFALDQALQSVEEAQQDYTDAVEEHGVESAEAERASLDLMSALTDLEAAAIDGDLSFAEFDDRLQGWVDRGRITQEQADAIRDRVEDLTGAAEDYSGRYIAEILADTGGALGNLQEIHAAVANLPRRRRITITAALEGQAGIASRAVAGVNQFRAHGGPVWPGEPFLVGERGPELVTFAESGMVHDASKTAAIMAGQARPVGGDGASQGGTVYAPVLNGFGMNEVQEAVRRGIRDAEFQSRTSGR